MAQTDKKQKLSEDCAPQRLIHVITYCWNNNDDPSSATTQIAAAAVWTSPSLLCRCIIISV